MNKRERILLFTLAGLFAVGGSWALYYFFYAKPMDAIESQIARLKTDTGKLENEEAALTKKKEQIELRDQRLRAYKALSLPGPNLPENGTKAVDDGGKHLNEVKVAYNKYLNDLLLEYKFNPNSISVTPKQEDSRATGSGPNAGNKTPVFTKLTFSVKGTASLAAIEQALTHFYKDPLLQQVHSITINKPQTMQTAAARAGGGAGGAGGGGRGGAGGGVPGAGGGIGGFGGLGGPGAGAGGGFGGLGQVAGAGGGRGGAQQQSNDLEVDFQVDALLVTNAEPRDITKGLAAKDVDTSIASVVAEPKRDYDAMLLKNIFLGTRMPTDRQPTVQAEDKDLVLRFVRLTTITNTGSRGRWEAYFYDQGKGLTKDPDDPTKDGSEYRRNAVTLPEIQIKDRFGNEVLTGQIVLLDDHILVFQSPPKDGKFYKMTTGDYFSGTRDRPGALQHPLTDAEIKELGLKPVKAAAAPAEDAPKAVLEAAPIIPQ